MKKFRFAVKNKDFAKSSTSDHNPFCCVEVARKPEGVAVRDSKDPKGPVLFFKNDEWAAFVQGVKKNEFEVV